MKNKTIAAGQGKTILLKKISIFRCCLCPNIDKPFEKKCPPGPPNSYFKKKTTPCRFVRVFIDEHKYKIFVTRSLKNSSKWIPIKYIRRKNYSCQIGLEEFKARKDFDEAQSELNDYAIKKGWKVYL